MSNHKNESANEKERLLIFDTTLRDGEQSPGAAMVPEAKLAIARQLERLRVDVIEAGFPASSEGDAQAVREIAKAIKESVVCGLARAVESDIRAAADAVRPAARPRIHTFIATSQIHMKKKLGMEPATVKEAAADAVRLARTLADDVEFSPEDAGRSDVDFLCEVVETAIKAGARTINIPDTVGYTLPHQFAELIRTLIERVPNSDKARFSVHCHDDLGLAVANSISAVQAGARQVECTINGIGERAGNASLEEVVMAVRTRRDSFSCDTRIDATQMVATSRMVSSATGFVVQPNKAIVGANAFAHESGIHQDGMLKDGGTYEIICPHDVGWTSTKLSLGKLSGRNAFRTRLKELGIELAADAFDRAFVRFKELADKKKETFDDDIFAIVSELDGTKRKKKRKEIYKLKSWKFASRKSRRPHATLGILCKGKSVVKAAAGDGLVDASFKAIEKAAKSGSVLELYAVQNVTDGSDSQGQVNVRLRQNGFVVNGHGSDTDIIVASAKAYLNALNKAEAIRRRGWKSPQAAATV